MLHTWQGKNHFRLGKTPGDFSSKPLDRAIVAVNKKHLLGADLDDVVGDVIAGRVPAEIENPHLAVELHRGLAGVEFDAAVVDLHLGEGPDGFAVIDRLRPRGVRRIALVTADTRDGLNEQATAAGAVLLPKPIKPAALKAFLSS